MDPREMLVTSRSAAGTCGFTLEYVARTLSKFICGRAIPAPKDLEMQ